MNGSLKRDFEWFVENHEDLVAKYNGKCVVIKDCKVLGTYENDDAALEATTKEHELGTFIVQRCTPGDKDYTQRFHSRVSFA